MKRLLILILPILVIVSMVLGIFGIIQVRVEEERLMDDLTRKARAVADSMELSARHIVVNNDLKNAYRLVEKFQKRERLQGCVLYGKDGEMLAVTDRFSEWKEKDKLYIGEVINSKIPRGAIERFKQYTVYSYTMPLLDDSGNVEGAVEIIYDTSYLFAELAELWKRLSVTLIVLTILIVIIASFLQKHIFTLPVQRLTEWFKHFQRGDTDEMHPIKEKGDLGKLATEVEQVALGLRVARKNVTEEAHMRIQHENLWTEAKLRDLVRAKLGENSLFVVSNREPYMHVIDEPSGKARCVRPASGMVTAIDPVMRACGGTWVAHGSGNADRKFVNSKDKLGVPPEANRYILKRVWLSKEEEDGYYYGFSNEGLWPLCHITHTRPIFREEDWNIYKEVNRKFADSVIEELPAKGGFVFIQDYHFTLLPRMIKEKRPDVTIGMFWHIPWPNPEVFSICPYQRDILDGMLSCDLIGFHVQYHCNNFLDTANRLLECRIDTEKFSVVRANETTFVKPFPISVDNAVYANARHDDADIITRLKQEFELEGKIVALGVDRIDYTKGIIERLAAIDRFLEKYPAHRGKFIFIQIAAPSRTHIKRYHDLGGEIDEMIDKVNWKYSDGNWKPIIYLKRHFSPEEIRPFYCLADICIVSSLHDGMNLVAKEYISSQSGSAGALILSRFTGADRELAEAIHINPYSIEDFADNIKLAIVMPEPERRKRIEKMATFIEENNIYKWAGGIISEIISTGKT